MVKKLAGVVLICSASSFFAAQNPTNDSSVLLRRYREGEKLSYQMKGINQAWHYTIQADGAVKRDSAGTFFEEYRWSSLISDHQKVSLSPASLNFREQLSLDPNYKLAFPSLSQVDHRLVGPITDFLTFYADLRLVIKADRLTNPGDHFYVKRGTPNSWADGNYVLIGEDSIDFDLSLKDINRPENTATILIRHVPPEKPDIRLPAEWMRKSVADTANNFVQVQRTKDGKYLAAVGKETFEVELRVSLSDGKILSGKMDNPVETMERECMDAALTMCGDPRANSIRRQVQIFLKP
jgi:hypothetical protein